MVPHWITFKDSFKILYTDNTEDTEEDLKIRNESVISVQSVYQ